MLNKTITLEQVLSLNPCYSKEKILRLSLGKTEMTIGDVIDLRFPHVPADHKLWLLLRKEIIPVRTLHEFAIWCAETALTKANVTDERSWDAVKVKRLWLDGKATDKKLDAAWDAAWDAARNAVMDAAKDSARNAAMYAARYDAMTAAMYAAGYAAMTAAWNAARYDAMTATKYAARDEQLAKLKEMLGG